MIKRVFLGEKLKQERKALQFSQERVARYLGVSGAHISRMEGNLTDPNISLVLALENLFDVVPGYFIGEKEIPNESDLHLGDGQIDVQPQLKELLRRVSTLEIRVRDRQQLGF